MQHRYWEQLDTDTLFLFVCLFVCLFVLYYTKRVSFISVTVLSQREA